MTEFKEMEINFQSFFAQNLKGDFVMNYLKNGYAKGEQETMKAPYKMTVKIAQFTNKDLASHIKNFGANSDEVEAILITELVKKFELPQIKNELPTIFLSQIGCVNDDYPELPPFGYFDVDTKFNLTNYSFNAQREEFTIHCELIVSAKVVTSVMV